jgi:hypothetical protein
MPESKSDDMLLLIRCPACGQRFKVGEDLRGRSVECGACEHRFRINDEVIVRGKKFYPGERRDARLERFHRVPLAVAPPIMGTQTVRYAEPPDPAVYEPAPPQRILAGILGVAIMSLMALLLMFGGGRGGMLDGMVISNRLLMAGFTGLLGTVLLLYANPRARGKAALVGLLFCIGLCSLPFVFKAGSTPLAAGDRDMPPQIETPPELPAEVGANPPESPEITALRQLIGTDPLVDENQRLQLAGSTRRAVGLWLRDMREHNRYLIREYMLRTTGADPQSHFFPRGDGNFLLVVTGISLSLEEVARLAPPLGSVEAIHHELDVIEVKVDNSNFIEGPIEKLNDRNDPAFYDLNKRELYSIDLMRCEKAVKRLTEAEPKVYRSDITSRLLALLGTPEVKFKAEICRALAVWSEEPGVASQAALREVRQMMAHGVAIPVDMVALIVREKHPEVLPVIHELWEQNPQQWESLYAEVGPPAEQALLRRLPTAEGSLRHSLVRLLGRVGGAASLPALQAGLPDANPELRVLLENSITAIRSRAGD